MDQVLAGSVIMAGLTLGGTAYLLARGNKPVPCDICGGMGSWKCVICDGNGTIKSSPRVLSKCKACVGRGKRLCRKCNATGWRRRSSYVG